MGHVVKFRRPKKPVLPSPPYQPGSALSRRFVNWFLIISVPLGTLFLGNLDIICRFIFGQ